MAILGWVMMPLATQADITFNFSYVSGTEFQTIPAAQTALTEAASTVGGWFDTTATLNIDVSTFNNSGDPRGAEGGIPFPFKNNTTNQRVITAVLLDQGVSLPRNNPDGTLLVNFAKPWNYGDAVPNTELDFKFSIMHELIHILGFQAFILENGDGVNNTASYGPFDHLLSDKDGNRVIDISGNNYSLNASVWNAVKTGGTSPAGGLFFDGSNAKAANGGLRVGLNSPFPYVQGSSAKHIDSENPRYGGSMPITDGQTHPRSLMAWFQPKGVRPRVLNAVERGMMQDLGYRMKAEPPWTASVIPQTDVVSQSAASHLFHVQAPITHAWSQATTSDPWITIDSPGSFGNGAVAYSLTENTGAARTGTIQVSGETFTVTQLGDIVVTTEVDEDDGSLDPAAGDGVSLREAVKYAPAGETVTFAGSLNRDTLVLTSGPVTIDKDLTLDASALGGGVTISGNGATRVLELILSANDDVVLRGLTVASGFDSGNGGGIQITVSPGQFATVLMEDCSVTGCQSSADGGGIYNEGAALDLKRCTLSGNTAATGGGLYTTTNSTGQSTALNQCTIAGNSATVSGGGLQNRDGELSLFRCTVSANTAPSGQGSGIASFGSGGTQTRLSSTLVAGNTGSDADVYPGDALTQTFVSNGYNWIGGTNNGSFINGTTDLTTSGNPQLASLGPYGGRTETMPPFIGSAAVDAGSPSSPPTEDQRGAGFPRVVGAAPEIGATEFLPEVQNLADSGPGSLRELVENAPDGTRITFPSEFSNQTLPLQSPLVFNGELTVASTGSFGNVILSGSGVTRVITTTSGSVITLEGLTIADGYADNGAGIYNQAQPLTLLDCTIEDNEARNGSGGGILNGHEAQLFMERCTVENNTASGNGGGIDSVWLGSGTETLLYMQGCTLTRNRSGGSGGGVSARGQINLLFCTLAENVADQLGGGLHSVSLMPLVRCTVVGNRAGVSGGGACVSGFGQLVPEQSIIADNRATSGPDLSTDGVFASVAPVGANLIGNHASVESAFPAGPLVGTPAAPLDPVLAPLSFHGGPTQTMPPMVGSPVIDAGNALSVLGEDQRGIGFDDLIDGNGDTMAHADLGSVEVGPAILVTTAADEMDGSGVGGVSLREAMDDASVRGTRILFDPTVFNGEPGDVITLQHGQLGRETFEPEGLFVDASNITGGVTLDGDGVNTQHRILTLDPVDAVTLSHLTLMNGQPDQVSEVNNGGAIRSGGSLTLNHCTVQGNRSSGGNVGGGVEVLGSSVRPTYLLVQDSLFSANDAGGGGGLAVNGRFDARIVLRRSTFCDNRALAGRGGAVLHRTIAQGVCSMRIEQCTFSANHSFIEGGAIHNNGIEGGWTELTIHESTFSGNSARRGGAIHSDLNETVNSGPGGILRLRDCIVARNRSFLFSADIWNQEGMIEATGRNLLSSLENSGLQAGASVSVVADPLLASLGCYGGPTPTMPPLAGSPAIDQIADSSSAFTDQRGFERTVGGSRDIGAVEAGPVILVTTATDETVDPGTGVSLREALAAAAAAPMPGQRVLFDPVVFNGEPGDVITLVEGELGTSATTPDGLFVDASNIRGKVTVDANGAQTGHRVLEVGAGHQVALHSLILRGGDVSGLAPGGPNRGGGIRNLGCLTLDHVELTQNTAGVGGGLFNEGRLTLHASTVAENRATNNGGGIYNHNSPSPEMVIRGSTLRGNRAENNGAGLLNASRMTVENSTVAENVAGSRGGGLSQSTDEISILRHVTMVENQAIGVEGGGISMGTNARLVIENCLVGDNVAGTAGPDIRSFPGGVAPVGLNLLSNLAGSALTNNNEVDVGAPMVAPFGWYGGPVQTRHPLAGSLAINATETTKRGGTDARGFSRWLGANATDIGAVQVGPEILVSTNVGTGPDSLRQALAEATEPGTVIRFDAAVFDGEPADAIVLGGSELLAAGSTPQGLFIEASNIDGGVTVDAGGSSRVLRITPGNTVALHGVTLKGGNATGSGPDARGGGIYNDRATVSLSACSLIGNSAGASGGGIYSDGRGSSSATVSLTACTLSGNSGNGGGGIYSDGRNVGRASVSLTACTLSGNEAISGSGGGVFGNGFGGNAILSLRACTLSGNEASAAGGGIYRDGSGGSASLSLHNSILAGNTAPTGPDLREVGNVTEAVTAATGLNLLSSIAGSNIPPSPLPPEILVVADPQLESLRDYGGPTQTMPPRIGSPAIDAAGTTVTARGDQRGAPRLSGSAVDVGAVERLPLVVNTLVDENDGVTGSDLSLREAVRFGSPGDTVMFDPAVSGGTVTLGGEEIVIDRDLNLDATPLLDGLTVSGNDQSPIFGIIRGAEVVLEGLTIIDGRNDLLGGGIYVFSTQPRCVVTLRRCTLKGNDALSGGAIYSAAEPLTLENCTFTENTGVFGGAVLNDAALIIDHCTLVGNAGGNNGGGAIWNAGGVTLSNSIVAGNTVQGVLQYDIYNVERNLDYAATGQNIVSSIRNTSLGSTSGPAPLTDDPLLAPLADYGGPTPTMPPFPGSPAIEAAAGSLALDQIGHPRPHGLSPDIGAVEAFAFSSLAVEDSDNDGIDDRLEPRLGLTVGVNDSSSDQDGDGETDADELAAMTNPFDPNSVFNVSSMIQTGVEEGTGHPIFTITFPSFPGLSYYVDASQDLDFTTPDQTVGPIVPTGYSHSIQMTLMAPRNFVQVRVGTP